MSEPQAKKLKGESGVMDGSSTAHSSTAHESKVAEKICGKTISAQVRAEVKDMVNELKSSHNITPGLAMVLVGSKPDSASYVKLKSKAIVQCGMLPLHRPFPDTVTHDELTKEIKSLAADPSIHGILVQLPLPAHLPEHAILKLIPLEKDVDGFLAQNIGDLFIRGGSPPRAVPCTPAGVVEMLQRTGVKVSGAECVVLGRGNLVGMPTAALLQSMNGTVTVCHSQTANLEAHVKRADILVAAVGKPRFVRGDWLKPGCVVIDVGVNSIEDKTRKRGWRLVGDVHYDECKLVASKITPVPGGVGPMTIAMLMRNLVGLARLSVGLPRMPLRTSREGVPNA